MAHGQLSKVMGFLRRRVAADAGAVTDRQLLERFAAQRDEHAFAALVDRHGPMVLAVCRRVLGDVHAADDAFQATFLVLAQKASALTWQESAGGWLHEVAYRVAAKTRGDAARRRAHERQVPAVSTVPATDAVSLVELRQVLDEELTRLPEKYRAPLVLCYLEGKTNEEAAALLGWTKGTVSGQLARARDLLRTRLSRRGLALPASAGGVTLTECAAPAAVPPSLATSTIQAALLGTAAQAAAAGVVTASVAALAEGVVHTMFVTKLKMAAVLLAALTLVAGGGAWLGHRTLAGGDRVALAPLPEEPKPAAEAPRASEPVEMNGLHITVKADEATFAANQALSFTVTLKNTSKKDFTFLETPVPLRWCKFYFPGAEEGSRWEALPPPEAAAPARPRRTPPYVLQAGQSVAATLRLDENYSFFYTDNSLAKRGREKHLPAGAYRLTIDLTFPGATKDVDLAGKPPLWVGEVTTKPAAFAVGAKVALSDTAKERVQAFKDNIDKFELRLNYYGPEDKPFYRFWMTNAKLPDEFRPFLLIVRFDKRQAEKLIDHLAVKGYLDRAAIVPAGKNIERRGEPHYVYELVGPPRMSLEGDLGWGNPLLQSLQEIRQGLDAPAARELDTLIGRLPLAPAGAQEPVPATRREINLRLPSNQNSALRGTPVVRSAAEWKALRDNNNLSGAAQDLDYLDAKIDWAKHFAVVIDGGYHTTVARIQMEPLVVENNKLLVPYEVIVTEKEALSHPVTVLVLDRFAGDVLVGGRPKQAAALVTMRRVGGLVPNAAKRISEFVLRKDGTFTLDNLRGKLPPEAIDALVAQIEKADVGPGAEDAGTVQFTWLGKDGKEQSKLFTQPRRADCQKLLDTLTDLAGTHGARK